MLKALFAMMATLGRWAGRTPVRTRLVREFGPRDEARLRAAVAKRERKALAWAEDRDRTAAGREGWPAVALSIVGGPL